jgi:putative nucleotidyltransferase with HDIG domain
VVAVPSGETQEKRVGKMTIPAGFLDKIRNLDPLPITAHRLSQAVADDSVSINEIAELIEFDQAVATNILRISNSALYAGLYPIEDVRSAVARLGTNTLLNIVLGDYLRRLAVDAPMYDLTENDLWLHGAVASLAVTELIGEGPTCTIPRGASVAALVHDVGKLIIVRYMKADVRQLLEKCEKQNITFVEAERQVLGCDHAEVGGAIARRWNFPEEIIDAMERHHDPEVADPSPTLDGVMLANLVAKTLGTGLGAEGMNFELDPGCSRRQGITFTRFCRVCARTSLRIEELREAYGIAPEGTATQPRELFGT